MRDKHNTIVLLALSALLLTKPSTSNAVRSAYVTRDLSLSDVMFIDDVLFDVSVRSPLECAQVCSSMEGCSSFTYHRVSLTSCRGHAKVMTSNSTSEPVVGTKAYVIREAVSGN